MDGNQSSRGIIRSTSDMSIDYDNPFGVTKASEFSDEEINEYWVDFNAAKEVSFGVLLNPRELLPKYVIGSKGCGKTHILRYFSFPLQKIRHDDNLASLLEEDKYIGFYLVLSGLNSGRFKGKGIDEAKWKAIFEYYLELYLANKLLIVVLEIAKKLQLTPETNLKIIQKIKETLSNDAIPSDIVDLGDLLLFLNDLRGKIDFEIRNVAFTRELSYERVRIMFDPGDLIFGIPAALSEAIPQMKDVKFVYILDEYEKLIEWQKEYINSLVWDKQRPATFWIGTKRYGYTTTETQSTERVRNGSEYQVVDLDLFIRKNLDLYKDFALQLVDRRLRRAFKQPDDTSNSGALARHFKSKFERYDESSLIEEIRRKRGSRQYKHFIEFESKIKKAIEKNYSFEDADRACIGDAIEQLKVGTNDDPLEQKFKLYYFYFLWYKSPPGTRLFQIIDRVNREYENDLSGKDSAFNGIRDKRRKDLLAQLAKENNVTNLEFSGVDGLEKLVDLSDGNPRSMILCLKKAIEYATIKGENPLDDDGMISLDSQFLAVYDTAKWFYQDLEVLGNEGRNLYQALRNLAAYLVQERFCDKPVETTVSCFYIKSNELSEEALECIRLMLVHFVFFEDENGRPGKSSGLKERLFNLNKTLAPYWDLPTVTRGQVGLGNGIAEAIFNPARAGEFEGLYKKRHSQLNAPEFVKSKTTGEQEKLF